jgi:iron-sulfur cluster assembly protein
VARLHRRGYQRLVARDDDIPDTGGLRIVTDPLSHALSMRLAPSFEATDVVVADHGTRLFLSPAAAERLEERTLQAAINGGGSAFFLDH